MKAIRRFTVRTVVPESLGALDELAANLRWSWHRPTQELFRDIAPELWESSRKDPVALLGEVGRERLDELAADEAFVSRAQHLAQELRGEGLFWQMHVGRVVLLLLDTDIAENEDELRGVTDRLYGGGGEHRLLQELLLGIGGVRAIKRYAEITGAPLPEVFHMNEGHAGFQGLERISDLIGEGLTFEAALEAARAGASCFPASTPPRCWRSAPRSRARHPAPSTWR